jgi:FkbM family methyltransferase
MKNALSQLGQDKYVIQNIYKNKKNGFFVDVGASHGLKLSNTYLLEKDFGWDGICVEPNPNFYSKLIKNRSAKCTPHAAYSSSGETLEFTIAGVLSGIQSHVDYHKSVVKNPTIQVTTKTLTDILDEFGAPLFIEYLSLDTEGSELEVLKGINFDKYAFGFMTIEHNWVEPRRTEIRDLLLTKGYNFCCEVRHDDYYIYNNLVK